MIGPLATGAALAFLLSSDPPVVRSVRVEGAAEAAVRGSILVRSGEPLDDERVRDSIVLLSATDRFDEVRAEARATGADGAVDVVFVLRETPLLEDDVVEGADGSPLPRSLVSDARRAAGLRFGEPIREPRLRDIERRVREHLRAHGYLRAEPTASLVDPAHRGPGARLRITIARPEQQRLRSVRVANWPPDAPEAPLPKPGEVLNDANLARWRDRVAEHLRRRGHLRAEVRPESVQGDLVFFVEPGPALDVVIPGLGSKEEGRARDRFVERGLSQETIEETVIAIEEIHRAQGYRDVEVDVREIPRSPRSRLEIEARPGARWIIASVETDGDGAPVTPAAAGIKLGAPWVDAGVEVARERILRGLLEAGHARAQVTTLSRGEPGAAVLVFRVQPGPAYRVETIELTGLPPEDRGAGRILELATRRQRPFRQADVSRDRSTLLASLRDLGYLDARVEPTVELVDDPGLARVTFRAIPGDRISVDRIVLAGLRRTRPSVVMRESRLREGDWLSYQKLLDTQAGLAGTGLFSNIAIRTLPSGETARTLVIEAQEAPRTTIVPGVGYAERDKLRASVDVTRRNVSGLGRTASLFLRGSIRGSRALLSFTEPYAFGRRQAITFQSFAEDDRRDAFSFRRYGAQAQTIFPLENAVQLIAQYAFQRTRTFDVQTDCAEVDRALCDGDVSGPLLTLLRDTRDDAIDPRRGTLLQLEAQASLPFAKGDPFVKSVLSAARYEEVRRGVVIAAGLRLGAAGAFSDATELPVSERFFAGGASSLRGFETDRLGPQRANAVGDEIPVGGNGLAIASLEARIDVTRDFGVQVFVETGGLFARAKNLRLSDLREVAGVGVRYRSPVGPIRLEWAWILDRRPDEKAGQLHLGLGYAF